MNVVYFQWEVSLELEKCEPELLDAFHSAHCLAESYGHAAVDPEHLLIALTDDSRGRAAVLLYSIGLDLIAFRSELCRCLKQWPKTGHPSGQHLFFTERSRVPIEKLVACNSEITVSMLLMAFCHEKLPILLKYGVTAQRLVCVIGTLATDVRKPNNAEFSDKELSNLRFMRWLKPEETGRTVCLKDVMIQLGVSF